MVRKRKTVDQLLHEARARLARLGPEEASAAVDEGALLIDIRSDGQRARDGLMPARGWCRATSSSGGSIPDCDYRDPELARPDAQVVIVCNQGYQSSLAAATLKDMGFERATDLDGGFQAWRDAGLPVDQVIGLLYDVHGNLPALEAVLADARETGAERFVLGGDYASFGAWPRESVERLRELDATWIRGNVDRWLLDRGDAPPPTHAAARPLP